MIDAKLIPEGVQRCSLPKFGAWIAFWVIILLIGLVGAAFAWGFGLGVTNLDNNFNFALWIVFDLAIIALGAGAFFCGFLLYILRIKELKKIINLCVIVGFLCYSGALVILALEIGQPLRSWFGFWHANVHSMLTEVIFCITVYLIVLIIEFVPIILENRQLNKIRFLHHLAHNMHLVMPLFAGVGTFLSFFHQGSLGGLYGVLFTRPFVFREGFFIWPWTFFLFILSAIAAGPVFMMLITTVMEKITGKRLVDFSVKALMAKISGFLLTIYLFFKFMDTWSWAVETLPKMGISFEQVFHAPYGKWLMWLELGICGVLPAILLVVPALRNRAPLMYLGAFLTCAGVVVNRFVFTIQNLAMPVLPFEQWFTYVPHWTEIVTCGMAVAYLVIVLSLAYRYLPVFPQEKELNY